uniref:Uncharacterized protein n=1 Tax=Rhizophora mucronata TaxID=61149 RepID=A0A2P2QFG3_RHIMU
MVYIEWGCKMKFLGLPM